MCLRAGVKDAVKDKAEQVAPASPSDAASSIKAALDNVKLPSLAPDNPTDAATAAKQAAEDNPYKALNPKLFEGVPRPAVVKPWRCCTTALACTLTLKHCCPAAAVKEKVEDAMPAGAAASVAGAVKDAASSAQSALPDSGGQAAAAAADAAKSSPFGALFNGASNDSRP